MASHSKQVSTLFDYSKCIIIITSLHFLKFLRKGQIYKLWCLEEYIKLPAMKVKSVFKAVVLCLVDHCVTNLELFFSKRSLSFIIFLSFLRYQ